MIRNILKIFSILLISFCTTVQTKVSKPPEVEKIISEVENMNISEDEKKKIIASFKELGDYSREVFDKNISLENDINILKNNNINLEKKLQYWNLIVMIFWILLIIGLLILIGSIAWKFRKILGFPL